MKRVFVIASLNVDFTNYVNQLPKPGHTIFSDDFKKSPGGKGNNIVTNLKHIGANVDVVGCIGKDSNGKFLKDKLSDLKVDTSNISELDEGNTGFAHIIVDKNGENMIVVHSGTNNLLNIEMIPQRIIESSDIIVATLESPANVIEEVFKNAKIKERTTILNYSPALSININLLTTVEILILNEYELVSIIEHTKFESIHTLIKETGIKWVLCTKGKHGVSLISKFDQINYKGYIVDAVDTSGAGDAFLSGFVAGLASSHDINYSILIGLKYGAFATTKKGCQVKLPDLNEIKQFQEE